MSDMVKYKGSELKKDQRAAQYFTMSDIVHCNTNQISFSHFLVLICSLPLADPVKFRLEVEFLTGSNQKKIRVNML